MYTNKLPKSTLVVKINVSKCWNTFTSLKKVNAICKLILYKELTYHIGIF